VASSSPKIVAGALKHSAASKASNFPTPKSSPMRQRNPSANHESPKRVSEEKWIDGPRVSKFKVAEARHLMREINHVKQCETWIDGPNIKPLTSVLPGAGPSPGYGYMDSHKKTMIRQWVENQTVQIFQSTGTNTTPAAVPTAVNPVQYHQYYKSQQQQQSKPDDDRSSVGSRHEEFVNPLTAGLSSLPTTTVQYSESSIKTGLKQTTDYEHDIQSEKSVSHVSENRQSATGGCDLEEEDQDQDSGPSEVPPALPLIEPLGSREVSRHVSRESLCQNVMMMDCALQVTEDDIAKAMGG
jgi:kinesin family member 26